MAFRWIRMPSSAAGALAALSDSTRPGPIFSLSTGTLPFGKMPGVVAYLVAPSTSTAVLREGVLVCGEIVVSRLEGKVRKSYSYVYGLGSTGATVFGAQFKHFRLHHMPSSCAARPAELFGHNPLSPLRQFRRSGLTSA